MQELERILISDKLPTLPAVAVQLLELMKNPDSSIKEYVQVIRQDPAISAKILKSTNSSYFGFTSRISSIEQAVSLLGTTMVTSLSLSLYLADNSMNEGEIAEHFQENWRQSVIQAVASEYIGQELFPSDKSKLFLAGLLSDLGRLMMLKTIPEEYLAVVNKAYEDELELHLVESDYLKLNHIEAGVSLMMEWGLAEELVLGVQHSHHGVTILENIPDSDIKHFPQVTAFATRFNEYLCGPAKGPALQQLREISEKFFGWSEEEMVNHLTTIHEQIEAAADIFKIDNSKFGSSNEIMAELCLQLSNLVHREHVAHTQAAVRQQIFENERNTLKDSYQKLAQQTIRDPLTNIYNRSLFNESLERELSSAARTADAIGVLFLDVDHFKKLNDTYGHQFGDEVLVEVSQVLNNTIRKSDLLARYGGEEFVVFLSQPTLKGMNRIAERLRQAVEACELNCKGQKVQVTVSIGGAIAIPERHFGDLGKQMVQEADAAMYDSKTAGRNQCHVRSLINEEQTHIFESGFSKRFSRWCVRKRMVQMDEMLKLLTDCHVPHQRIGKLALEHQFLTSEQLDQILQVRKRTEQRFGTVAMEMGFLDEEHVAFLLAVQKENLQVLTELMVEQKLVSQEIANQLIVQYLAEEKPPRKQISAPAEGHEEPILPVQPELSAVKR